MKKRFYTDKGEINIDAVDLMQRVEKALVPFFEEFVEFDFMYRSFWELVEQSVYGILIDYEIDKFKGDTKW